MPSDAELLDALARVQLGQHALGQALVTIHKWQALRPDATLPLLRLPFTWATAPWPAAMLQPKRPGARAQAQRAIAQLPDSPAVLDTLAAAKGAERPSK